MSVQTQIDRISGAVSAALTALSEKGVTVPDGTKVDGLAALIAAIEAGGGGGGGDFDFSAYANIQKVTSGTMTFSETVERSITIEHGLNILPKFMIVVPSGTSNGYGIEYSFVNAFISSVDSNGESYLYIVSRYNSTTTTVPSHSGGEYSGSSITGNVSSSNGFWKMNQNSVLIGSTGKYLCFPAGMTINWVAGG